MSYIFISYSKKDIDFARRLRKLLRDEGFAVWMDEQVIEPSDDWWETIEGGIIGCAAFMIVMTTESRQSRWVRRERLLPRA